MKRTFMKRYWSYLKVDLIPIFGPSWRLRIYKVSFACSVCMCAHHPHPCPNLNNDLSKLQTLHLFIPKYCLFSKNKNMLLCNHSKSAKTRKFNVVTFPPTVLGVNFLSVSWEAPDCRASCGRCWVMKWRESSMTPTARLASTPGPAAPGRATGKEAPLWTQRSSSGRYLGSSRHRLLEISRVYSVSLRR